MMGIPIKIKINKLKLKLVIILIFLACVGLVNAQENPNCVEMVIDGEETMLICDEQITFNVDGEEKDIEFKAMYSRGYYEELIKSQKYVVPLDRVGFHPDKTPKTYLISYINDDGCIASNRIEYEGKPTDKTEICFCELDLDRNIADISYKYETKDISSISASEAFFENNECDVYVPKEIKRPTPQPIDSGPIVDPSDPIDPDEPHIPGEPDISQCLIDNPEVNPPVTTGSNFLFPLKVDGNPQDWSGVRLTQGFGAADGSLGYSTHTGIDLGYVAGTTIVAAKDGVVEAALTGWSDGYGNLTIIRHNVNGKKYYTYYAHQLSIAVKQGDTVKTGQKIGEVDSTGNSTGNHLHFEIRECASEGTVRTACKAINPKPILVFNSADVGSGNTNNHDTEPKYDQQCLDDLEDQVGDTPGLPPISDPGSLAGKRFECAFLKVSDALDRTVPPEFVYAVTRHESGGLNCTNNPGQSVPCTIDSLTKATRAYDNGFKVSGLSQFYYATFEGIVKAFPAEMDKCIASMGAELSRINDPKKIDPLLSNAVQQKYSRHITAHAICATGIIMRNYGTDWKSDYKGSYNFQVVGANMGLIDWYNVIGNNYNSATNRYSDSQTIIHNNDSLNPMEYSSYRYHGGNGCSTTKTLADIYPSIKAYQGTAAGRVTAFNAYCAKVNSYFHEARTNKLFESCGGTTQTPVTPPNNDTEVKEITAQSCTTECTDCKYFPINKAKPIRSDYSPTTVEVPNDIAQHTVAEKARLTSETVTALRNMFADAKSRGVDLAIRTGYRSYAYQDNLFEGYVQTELTNNPGITREEAEKRANQFSAYPGHSEHQLGTTADVTCLECTSDPFGNGAANQKAYTYLANEGYKFGFIVSYTPSNSSVTGFSPEGWHIRFIGNDLASEYRTRYNNNRGVYAMDQFLISKCAE